VCRFIDVILELKLRHYVDKDCLPKKSCKEIVYANILYQFHSKSFSHVRTIIKQNLVTESH
jgi:hypothetical protein